MYSCIRGFVKGNPMFSAVHIHGCLLQQSRTERRQSRPVTPSLCTFMPCWWSDVLPWFCCRQPRCLRCSTDQMNISWPITFLFWLVMQNPRWNRLSTANKSRRYAAPRPGLNIAGYGRSDVFRQLTTDWAVKELLANFDPALSSALSLNILLFGSPELTQGTLHCRYVNCLTPLPQAYLNKTVGEQEQAFTESHMNGLLTSTYIDM